MPVDPASLRIQIYPAAILRQKAAPIKAVTDEVRAVARRMIEVMYQEEGIGLAAPQIGLAWRMFVTHVPPNDERSPESDPPTATSGPKVFVNPVISKLLGPPEPEEEGCLSLPDIRGDVLRPPSITITALDEQGRSFSQTAAGLLARCMQHELDHLDGVLILDRFTQMSRLKNRSAIRELEKKS